MRFPKTKGSTGRAGSSIVAIASWIVILLISAAAMQGASRQFLSGHVPAAVGESKAVGELPASKEMQLAIGLPLRNEAELETFLKELADPASPNYRHYLTPDQFAERFGPSKDDYESLASFFEANGLAVTGRHPNRTILDVSGKVTDIERVFQIKMMNWSHPSRGVFFAPDREPSLDAGVAILDITGLDNFVVPRPMDLKLQPLSGAMPLTTGSGPAGLFIGNDFRAAYAPSVTLNGAGQAIGLFELDGFYSSDVAANFQQAGLSPVPVQTVLLDGFNGAPGSGNVEVTLDIMMASYMAPGASKIIVYEGTNWNDVLNRMATDNLASQLSSSWVYSPTNATTEQIFKQMIAQGQSLFQASGDSGAYKGAIMPPADDPNVTSVGGTSLTTTGPGGAWQSETAWSDSGGGVSTTWPIPSYQTASVMTAVGGSGTMRNIPDVAMLADIQIFLICNNGQGYEVGGTSAAAPLWAGFIALANQQAVSNKKPAVGFLNTAIYPLGAGSAYRSDLHDIISGSNGGFSAVPGYDLVTGWGTPAGQALINSLTGASSAPSFGLSLASSSLSIAPGASGTASVTISPQSGFSGAVSLTISGLPAGVTGSFSPASATSSSTLTVIASSTAAAGTYNATITGTSGTLSSTARLTLTITAPPSFTISATPASVSVAPGASTTRTITITPQNGFTGTVSLAASGLPSGVSASFSSANATTTSTLTLAATSSAAQGTYNVTVTGTSGTLRSTATITLTVTSAAGFTIATNPASVSIAQGASGTSTVTLTPQNGFNGAVTFAATGLPSGVTATFGALSAAHTSTVTFSASATAAAGTTTLTITGTSGAMSSKATIALTITAAPTFTLTATPAGLTVGSGASATSVIAIVAQNGFSGSVALTAAGLPSGVTASFSPVVSGKSTLTLTAAATAAAGAATVTVTGTSGSLTAKTTIALTITSPATFRLSVAPSALSIAQGASGSASITLTPQNGFSGSISVTISGFPNGVTPSLAAGSSGNAATLTLAVSTAASAGTSAITVSAKSGSISQTATINLTITAATTASNGTVNLAAYYNVMGQVTDGATFLSSSGLDGGGRAYSANLLSTVKTAAGSPYSFGPANAPGAVSGGTVTLPAGKYSNLKLLAAGVNGSQTNQTFTVTYTDGTTSTFTQSLSDWCVPQNYPGESQAVPMSYRDNSNGTRDTRTVLLYGYTFNLTSSKTVKTITLPANRNVVVLAITLSPAANTASASAGIGNTQITLSLGPKGGKK